jgi:dipeptidase E
LEVKLLLISSSLVHGYGYLEQPEPEIKGHFAGAKRIAFVPFAAFDHAAYTAKVSARFAQMGFEIIPIDQLDRAEGIFVGGGNTFRLLKKLYDRNLLDPIRKRVRDGLPYIGSSAGSIVTCPTIRTTNDMPIVECSSLDSFGFIPFQINGHYLDPDPGSTHKGETREDRLREFHEENATPVVGLREGTMLLVEDNSYKLLGIKPARIFRRGQEPIEVGPGMRLDEYVQ